jgi:hypothetical protein
VDHFGAGDTKPLAWHPHLLVETKVIHIRRFNTSNLVHARIGSSIICSYMEQIAHPLDCTFNILWRANVSSAICDALEDAMSVPPEAKTNA